MRVPDEDILINDRLTMEIDSLWMMASRRPYSDLMASRRPYSDLVPYMVPERIFNIRRCLWHVRDDPVFKLFVGDPEFRQFKHPYTGIT